MKEPYSEGVVTHTGPESCSLVRKDDAEALTGERTGRPLSREIFYKSLERRCCRNCQKATLRVSVHARCPWAPRGRRTRARAETS